MPIINFVQITTLLELTPAAPLNYIPIAAIPSATANGLAAFASTAAKKYASTDEMIDDGFTSTSPEVLAVAQMFGQTDFTDTVPTRAVIVKNGTYVAQVEDWSVVSAVDGTYELLLATAPGETPVVGASFVAAGSTLALIRDGLVTAWGLGPFAASYPIAAVLTEDGTVTSGTPGASFILTGDGPGGASDITVASNTANVGPSEALDAGFAVEKFWAVIPDPAIGELLVKEMSLWAENSKVTNSTRRNVCLPQSADSDIPDNVANNFAEQLQLLQRSRTFGVYHPTVTDHMNAAWFGRYGGQPAGSRAWHFGNLTGTTATSAINYTQTQGDNMKSLGFSWVERDGPASTDSVRVMWGQGSGPPTIFAVQKQAEDAWWLAMNAAIVQELESGAGVNLDETGIQRLVAAVDQVNITFASQDPPVLDLAQTVVTPVALSSVPAAELAVGDYKTTGGINVDTLLIPKGRSVRVSGVFATA